MSQKEKNIWIRLGLIAAAWIFVLIMFIFIHLRTIAAMLDLIAFVFLAYLAYATFCILFSKPETKETKENPESK